MPKVLRGVYRLDCFLSAEGFPVYVVVTSDGRRIAERVLYPFEDPGDVEDQLWDLLDEEDPIRRWGAA